MAGREDFELAFELLIGHEAGFRRTATIPATGPGVRSAPAP